MKSFFERLQFNIQNNPQRTVLRSDGFPDGYTYRQLDEASGKVCQYLKDRNIGKEDFVMILMPREASAYVSVIGVWKSGAAMILLEEDYSPERVRFIKEDLRCKLVITQDIFDEMMQCAPCCDYEIPALHDACYATYTSGSTGNPKGILHEFGKLDTFDYDYENQLLPCGEDTRFAIVTPLNFGPSIRNAVTALLYGKCLYVVPRSIVKNPKLLLRYFNENKISETSVTCSFFKACSFAGKYMRNVFVHSEPCTGVFEDGVNVINLYTLSEVVFPICSFRIDKPYDDAPLGHPNQSVEIKIVNETGETAKPYEIGEIVVEDVFTRGYINLPQKTAEAFVSGYFHSGDLGYSDENGTVYLCGRKDDMIKINGNRIEPMEIEATVKNTLGIKNILVKGFAGEDRSFVVAYLLKNELLANRLLDTDGNLIFSVSQMKDKLQSRLPDYMIPSYYTVLDAFPKNANGKLSRKDLPKPIVGDYLKAYEPPQNDAEAYFCRLFEKVLKLDKVGVCDDFYQIGGDSLSAMSLIAECEQFDVTITDIYQERTPRNLSRKVPLTVQSEDLQKQNEQALLMPQPLLPEQQAIFEWQTVFPDMILNNLTRFFRLKPEIDIDRFRLAVDKVFRHHPVFASVLVNENGTEKFCYQPERFQPTAIMTLSKTELQEIKDSVCKPFELEKHLLYRHAIYRCDDAVYFFLEIHHLITDGSSLKLLFREISECYADESAVLLPDYLYLLLAKNAAKTKHNMSPNEIRELYQVNEFSHPENNTIKYDNPIEELVPAKYITELNIEKNKITENDSYKKYKGNVFFLTCFLKAVSEFNRQNKVFSFWTYRGREQKAEQNIHGMLIRTMPMGVAFDAATDMEKAFETVKKNIDRQLACDVALSNALTDDFAFSPYFIYQKNILYSESSNGIFAERINLQGGCMAFEMHLIDNADEPRFRCAVKYAAGLYEENTVRNFCALFEAVIKRTTDEKCN